MNRQNVVHQVECFLKVDVEYKQPTIQYTTTLYSDSKRQDTVYYGFARSKSSLIQSLVPLKDIGENRAW